MAKQIVKATFWIIVGLVAAKFISLLIRMVVARLGVTTAGIFYLAMYILKFALIVSFLGFEAFIVREIAAASTRNKQGLIKKIIIYSSTILIPFSIVVAALLLFNASLISSWFNEPNLLIPLKIIAITIPFLVCLGIARSFFRGTQNWKSFLFFHIYGKEPLRLLAIIIPFLLLGTINAILFGQFVALAVLSIIALIFVIAKLGNKKSKAKFDWKNPFVFIAPLYGATLAIASLEWVDSFMIGMMLSVTEVGLYDTPFSMAWALMLIPSATATFFLPRIIEAHQKNKNLQGYYERVTAWNFAANGFIAAAFILLGKPLLHFLFGPEFVPGYIFLIILSIGFWLGHSLSGPAKTFLFVNKRGTLLFAFALTGVIVNIIANYILISTFGSIGAALATSFTIILLVLMYIIATYKDVAILPISGKMLTTVTAMFVAIAGWTVIKDLPMFYNIPGSFALLVVYAAIHLSSTDWRSELRYIIPKILHKEK